MNSSLGPTLGKLSIIASYGPSFVAYLCRLVPLAWWRLRCRRQLRENAAAIKSARNILVHFEWNSLTTIGCQSTSHIISHVSPLWSFSCEFIEIPKLKRIRSWRWKTSYKVGLNQSNWCWSSSGRWTWKYLGDRLWTPLCFEGQFFTLTRLYMFGDFPVFTAFTANMRPLVDTENHAL